MTRVYISGPMRGLTDLNVHEFNRVAQEYQANGYSVYNPARLASMNDLSRIMSSHLSAICSTIDLMVMLPGWRESKGAVIEHALAEYLGIEVHEY